MKPAVYHMWQWQQIIFGYCTLLNRYEIRIPTCNEKICFGTNLCYCVRGVEIKLKDTLVPPEKYSLSAGIAQSNEMSNFFGFEAVRCSYFSTLSLSTDPQCVE